MEAMIRIRCKGFCAQPKYHNEDEIGIWQYIFSFIKTETNDGLESSSENQK
jgi:hypothetical protein